MAYLFPIILLALSNVFMTFAWYWHLKFQNLPMWIFILISWGIAFFEYCLAVPANRLGVQVFSVSELKTLQEVITLTVFVGFAVFYLGDRMTLQHILGFAVIAMGAALIFTAPK
ncbi:MAG: hypothetical protein GC136_08035 [Alphaproteobacteria bacterium]|nr:hypothetical protein [Alphaproteobacteria bacterium]